MNNIEYIEGTVITKNTNMNSTHIKRNIKIKQEWLGVGMSAE